MRVRCHLLIWIASIGLLLAAGMPSARAQYSEYVNDPADFDAATTGNTTYNFPFDGETSNPSSPYTFGPLTFSTPYTLELYGDEDYGSGIEYLAADNDTGSNFVKPNEVSGSEMDISLSGATALELILGTYESADTVSVTVNGTPVTGFDSSGGYPDTTVYGLTSTVPITSVVLTLEGGTELDIIDFEEGTSIPEPSTWAILLLGGAVFLAAGRFLRQTQAA